MKHFKTVHSDNTLEVYLLAWRIVLNLLNREIMWEWNMYLYTHTCVCVFMFSHFSCVQLFVTLWTVAFQAPLSMWFSRQEYWCGLPCLPPGDLPDLGMEPMPACISCISGRFFTHWTTWEAHMLVCVCVCVYNIYILYIFTTDWHGSHDKI